MKCFSIEGDATRKISIDARASPGGGDSKKNFLRGDCLKKGWADGFLDGALES